MESQKIIAFGLRLKELIGVSILVILYSVGIYGIGINNDDQIINLTPVNLLISLIIVVYFHIGKYPKLLLILGICFAVGFLVELVGVKTGLIFGTYTYGPVLGPKFMGTPFMIGVNWALLIYLAGSSINMFFAHWNIWIKSIYAALCLVFLDYIIEPVAIHFNFWQWAGQIVPMQNYLAWGVISFLLSLLFFKSFKIESNKVAYVLFILQFVFFGILNLILIS